MGNGRCLPPLRSGRRGIILRPPLAAGPMGEIESNTDFGGGVLQPLGGFDIMVASFDSSGKHRWSKRFGDSAMFQEAKAVAADAAGNVFIPGNFDGSVNFGSGPVVAAGGKDVFALTLDGGGQHVWSKRFGGKATRQTGSAVAVGPSGNVLVGCTFAGTMDLGGGPLSSVSNALFLARHDVSGAHLWSGRFGEDNDFNTGDVAVDGSGSVIHAGGFMGKVDFGDGPLSSAGGSYDVVVAKLPPGGN